MGESVGLELLLTERMRTVLESASISEALSQEVRQQAKVACQSATHVQWGLIKAVVAALNIEHGKRGQKLLYLHQLCSGSTIALPEPVAKQPNSELQARRQKLQANLERIQYDGMVADITQHERAAEDIRGLLNSSQSQMSFGVHVLVTMFTFFAVSYWGTKEWFDWDELWAGLAGALGLTFGLLLETVLLITRSNMPEPLEDRYPHLFGEQWNLRKKAPGAGVGSVTQKKQDKKKQ